MKNVPSLKKILKTYAICFAIANIPQFMVTYTTPKEELKQSISEHLSSEMNELRDMSGGFTYANFRLLGSTTGYFAKRLTVNIEDIL